MTSNRRTSYRPDQLWLALVAAAQLRALAAEQPAILGNLVQFQSQGGGPGRPAPVQAQLELFVLKERQP